MSVFCFHIFIISFCFLLHSVSSSYLLLCKRPLPNVMAWSSIHFMSFWDCFWGSRFWEDCEWVCLRLQAIARGAAGAGGLEEGPLGSWGRGLGSWRRGPGAVGGVSGKLGRGLGSWGGGTGAAGGGLAKALPSSGLGAPPCDLCLWARGFLTAWQPSGRLWAGSSGLQHRASRESDRSCVPWGPGLSVTPHLPLCSVDLKLAEIQVEETQGKPSLSWEEGWQLWDASEPLLPHTFEKRLLSADLP